jgi:hypothetical protein
MKVERYSTQSKKVCDNIGIRACNYIFLCVLIFVALDSSGGAQDAMKRPRRLSTYSPMGALVVPANRRLGTFAIDFGLSLDGPTQSIQTNYLMERIFSGVGQRLAQALSSQRCRTVLNAGSYPFVSAFMYKSQESDATNDARAACAAVFDNVLENIGVNELGVVMEVMHAENMELTRRHEITPEAAQKFPVLVAIRSLREAIRRLYSGDSAIHALLSVSQEQLSSIVLSDFQKWMRDRREDRRIRLLTEDTEMWPYIGRTEAEQMPILPTTSTLKESARILGLKDIDVRAIRVAVLAAVDVPQEGKMRNQVVEKYCRGSTSGNSNISQPHCWFENIFEQEAWICLYFDADDGADDLLRKRAQEIAADPIVIGLSAQRNNGEQVGHPYVVTFGGASL